MDFYKIEIKKSAEKEILLLDKKQYIASGKKLNGFPRIQDHQEYKS